MTEERKQCITKDKRAQEYPNEIMLYNNKKPLSHAQFEPECYIIGILKVIEQSKCFCLISQP